MIALPVKSLNLPSAKMLIVNDKRSYLVSLGATAMVILFFNLALFSGVEVPFKIRYIPIPIPGLGTLPGQSVRPDANASKIGLASQEQKNFEGTRVNDHHHIVQLMRNADVRWRKSEQVRSMTLKETVAKYIEKYGRNAPPRFKEWYTYARERGVHNIDDFGQIMDDLRPFWAMEPATIRSLAAHMHEDPGNGISGLHIRDGKIWKLTNANWRVDTLAEMVKPFVKFLPNMDIAMNRLDQPRVVVPWDLMQALLRKEEEGRRIQHGANPDWTKDMKGFLEDNDTDAIITDPKFFTAHGQQYMKIAREACPPGSHARNSKLTTEGAEESYKSLQGGFITNFNRSTDLCTIGPGIEEKHGFLFAPSTILASNQLLPIFGESKVNINSDILFPANMYYKDDKRYVYDSTFDYDWDDKEDIMIWRGVTSGGTNTAENWMKMHRQRLALMTNSTVMANQEVGIMIEDPMKRGFYKNWKHFHLSHWIEKHTDVGFTEAFACFPNCDFYGNFLSYKNVTTLSQQFVSKYLIDIDGHSFSGRWRAFLHSKSLGIKSTIFREWHDSRLFEWRHFVPLDNRYDELYSILTYFIGLGSPAGARKGEPYVPRHDSEARKLAQQGREWAAKVLRREDLEIYLFRLLIEYGRLIDDNRDVIGYVGDGSELERFDAKHTFIP